MIQKLVKKSKTLTAIQYDGTEESLLAIASIFGTVEPTLFETNDWAIGVPMEGMKIVSNEEKEVEYLQLNTNPIATIMEGFVLPDSVEAMTSTMSIKNEAGEVISFETTTITEDVTNLIQRERKPKIGEDEEE